MPRQVAAIDHPVSVCHQWSITGTPSFVINGKPLNVAYNSMRRATHMEWDGNRYEFPRDAERMTEILNDALPEDKRVK